MSMHKTLRQSLLAPVGIAAFGAMAPPAIAQTEAAAPRTVAALPAELADTGELTPPSPGESAAVENPGLDANFGLGRPATPQEIAAIDIDVMPDGRGLPPGSGTYAQGETLFAEKCVSCHGENLEGVKELGGPALIGGRGTLASATPVKTVESYLGQASTLYDYIHRAMPLDSPGSMSPDQVYAISAYILGQGGIIDKTATLDAASLPAVKMPNADGFVADPRPDTP